MNAPAAVLRSCYVVAVVRTRVACVGLVLGACANVEPLEPVPSTAGSASLGTDGSPMASSSESDGSASSSAADETGEVTSDTAATSAADVTGGSDGPCSVGSEGCACTPADACDPGLTCLSGFCVDVGPRCPVGAEGCPCTRGGACDLGLQCASMICVDPG